jgi:hypothetical protein
VLGEGGIIVESNGLAQRGFDAGEDRQHSGGPAEWPFGNSPSWISRIFVKPEILERQIAQPAT